MPSGKSPASPTTPLSFVTTGWGEKSARFWCAQARQAASECAVPTVHGAAESYPVVYQPALRNSALIGTRKTGGLLKWRRQMGESDDAPAGDGWRDGGMDGWMDRSNHRSARSCHDRATGKRPCSSRKTIRTIRHPRRTSEFVGRDPVLIEGRKLSGLRGSQRGSREEKIQHGVMSNKTQRPFTTRRGAGGARHGEGRDSRLRRNIELAESNGNGYNPAIQSGLGP